MIIRKAEAEWRGSLKQGTGKLRVGSGVFEGAYSFPSRFENGPGTNPEELLAAAHAGCFSMALTALLEKDRLVPTSIHTVAQVQIEPAEAGMTLTRIELVTQGDVPGLDAVGFQRYAEQAKHGCLVSRALAGVKDVTLAVNFTQRNAP
jgi:osmotically inducible protein OsmC